ncbi:hypothetical protein Droror1_Dr00006235 [Drosera rotundifolia]
MLFSSSLCWGLNFEWKIVKFFYFYYCILMCFIYYNLHGMMAIALTPVHLIATIVMSFFPLLVEPVWWFSGTKEAFNFRLQHTWNAQKLILPVIVKRYINCVIVKRYINCVIAVLH